jgi:hypothetical protein
MSLTTLLIVVGIFILAFFLIKGIEKLVKRHFLKVKSVLTATTAYDLCKLYKKRIISRRQLIQELSSWIFVPENPEVGNLKEEWRAILPPDPFGSFEDQIGKAYQDRLISREIYDELLAIYKTSDDIGKDEDNGN